MHAKQNEWADISTQTVSLAEHEALKKELRDFIYIMSHDMNAPLRHIREFTKLLTENIGDSLNETSRAYARAIEQSVKRSEAMIDGLLQLSRLNTHAQPIDMVDCNEVMEQVHYTLSHELKAANATIRVSPLPTLKAEAFHMLQLFTHLLQNAIAFRHDDTPLTIDISAQQQPEGWQFDITDNGIGVESGQEEAIFGLFKQGNQHPHPPENATGVGLTICQKIVEGHGGTIWVKPNQPRGSTFCFTMTTSA